MFSRTDRVNFKTYSLIGRIALDGEQVKLARIIDASRARGLEIRGCHTDSVFVQSKRKRFLGKTTTPGQEIANLFDFCRIKRNDKIPRCKWDRRIDAFEQTLLPNEWATNITDTTGHVDPDQLVANGGGLVVGLPGVGKTHLLKALRDKLPGRVATTAFQIATSRRIGGQTLLHLLHSGTRYDWIIIDEGSQIPTTLYSHLAAMQYVWGTKFAIFADFAQLPPVCDRWQPSLPPNGLEDTKLIRRLVGDFKLTLTFNHRARNDPMHFQAVERLHASVLSGCERVDVEYTDAEGVPDVVVCLSNRTRLAANRWLNRLLCPPEHILIKKPSVELEPPQQDMLIWVGLELVGTRNGKKVDNGVCYRVVSYTDAQVTVREVREDDHENDITLSHEEASIGLRLRHAMTCNIAQGQTISGVVWLLDTDHRFWSARRHLVAMSRVTCSANLKIPHPMKIRELLA
jgi:hypothetical protein